MEKYHSAFAKIRLEDTGVMKKSSKDAVYSRLSKNGATNLKELFELDDLQGIDYGNTSYFLNVIYCLQAKGVLKLLRARYLGEDYPYLDILESTVNKINQAPKAYTDINNVTIAISKLGLHRDFAYSISTSKKANLDAIIIDELERVYLGEIPVITNKPNYQMNKMRIGIILEWYYTTIYHITLGEEYLDDEELKKKALSLKDVPEKKREYILTRVELERRVLFMEQMLAQRQSHINQFKLS